MSLVGAAVGLAAALLITRYLPWRSVVRERHDGHLVEWRTGPHVVLLRVDGKVVARRISYDGIGAVRFAFTTDDGLLIQAGQQLDAVGDLQPWLEVTRTVPIPEASTQRSRVPELGTVHLLLDELEHAFGDDDLSGPLGAIGQIARRHAAVLDRAASGEIGGPDGEALVETHRASLVGIATELRRLRDRLVESDRDGEIRDALLRLTAAAELQAATPTADGASRDGPPGGARRHRSTSCT